MHWLGYSVCPWSSQLRESETFPQAAVPALLWPTHPQHTVSSPKAQSLLIIWPNVFSVVTPLSDRTLKDTVTGFFPLVCFFIKKYFSLKVSVFFCLFTVGLGGVYPSPLSVAKLHRRMSYHRHICRKYAMKLCGSCTTRAICPLPPSEPSFLLSAGASCQLDSSTQQACLSLSWGSFSYMAVKTGTQAQNIQTKLLRGIFF